MLMTEEKILQLIEEEAQKYINEVLILEQSRWKIPDDNRYEYSLTPDGKGYVAYENGKALGTFTDAAGLKKVKDAAPASAASPAAKGQGFLSGLSDWWNSGESGEKPQAKQDWSRETDPNGPIHQLQKALGVPADGAFGPNSKRAWATKTNGAPLPPTPNEALKQLSGDEGGGFLGGIKKAASDWWNQEEEEPEDEKGAVEEIQGFFKWLKRMYAGPIASRFFIKYLSSAVPGSLRVFMGVLGAPLMLFPAVQAAATMLLRTTGGSEVTEKDLSSSELEAIKSVLRLAKAKPRKRKPGAKWYSIHYKQWMLVGAQDAGVDTSSNDWQLKAPAPPTVWGYDETKPLPETPEQIRRKMRAAGDDPREPSLRKKYGLDPLPSFTSGAGFAQLTVGASDIFQQMAVTFGQASWKKEGDEYIFYDVYDFVGGAARKAVSLADAKSAAEESGIGLGTVEKFVQVMEDNNLLKEFPITIRIPASEIEQA